MTASAITDMANKELAKVEASMEPQMSKLRDQVTSTELVDDARANSAVQAAGAQGAVTRSRNAAGVGGTTRQQALAKYQAKVDANKAQVGATNNAILNQSKTNEAAQSKLNALNTQLAQTSMSTKLDAAKADQQYAMHKENLNTQKKNNKKAFWGKVAGAAVGALLV